MAEKSAGSTPPDAPISGGGKVHVNPPDPPTVFVGDLGGSVPLKTGHPLLSKDYSLAEVQVKSLTVIDGKIMAVMDYSGAAKHKRASDYLTGLSVLMGADMQAVEVPTDAALQNLRTSFPRDVWMTVAGPPHHPTSHQTVRSPNEAPNAVEVELAEAILSQMLDAASGANRKLDSTLQFLTEAQASVNEAIAKVQAIKLQGGP